jgi:hypothetical protein
MEARQASVSLPPWLTVRPQDGHFGVSDETGLRSVGTAQGARPVRPSDRAKLPGTGRLLRVKRTHGALIVRIPRPSSPR